jgi:hypothetical protein
MARTRKGVTILNSLDVYNYFNKSFGEYARCVSCLKKESLYKQAKRKFYGIDFISYCDINDYQFAKELTDNDYLELITNGYDSPSPTELNLWVLKYVSQKGWKQCLANIRQRKHAKKNISKLSRKVQFKISKKNSYKLKTIAKENPANKSLDDFLSQLNDRLLHINYLAKSKKITTLELLDQMISKYS